MYHFDLIIHNVFENGVWYKSRVVFLIKIITWGEKWDLKKSDKRRFVSEEKLEKADIGGNKRHFPKKLYIS